MTDDWEWDPTLYAGSAAYYPRGRVAYPAAVVDTIVDQTGLDGSGRLLDIGCGPGSLTVPLAAHVAEAVGVDADQGMLDEAARACLPNARWVRMRAEDLPADLGTFRLVTFAQSFHWFDRPRVAATVRDMLNPEGACVHVHATTHRGIDDSGPPYPAIEELVRRYLGPVPRAGRSAAPNRKGGEEIDIYRAAGFTGPVRSEIPGWPVTRTIDEVVAATFSLSGSTPHLFGPDREAFETDLRTLLEQAAPNGTFTEQMREIAIDVWRP